MAGSRRVTGTSVATPSLRRNSVASAARGGRSGPLTGAHQPIASTRSDAMGWKGMDGSPGPVAGTATAAVQMRARAPAQNEVAAVRQPAG
jgi:hypothetical protein